MFFSHSNLEEGFRVTVRNAEWKLVVNPEREKTSYTKRWNRITIRNEPYRKKELRKIAERHLNQRVEIGKVESWNIEYEHYKIKTRFLTSLQTIEHTTTNFI